MFSLFGLARKSGRLLAAFGALFALSACDDISQINPVSGGPSTGNTVKVALLLPYGSPTAGDTGIARSLENAARLAAADLGGKSVQISVYNTQGSAQSAASLTDRAIAEGAQVIVGPLRSDAANASAIAASDDGVNVLSFSNNASVAGANLFILGNTFQNISKRLLQYSARQGRNRLVVVSANTPVGQISRNAVTSAAQSSGVQVVGTNAYNFDQESIVAAVPKIASTIRSSGANALMLTSGSTEALPILAQLLPEQGVSPAVTKYLGLTRWDLPRQTLNLPGLQGGWFALPDPLLSQKFRARYKASYGEEPHPLAGLAYDGVAAVGALAAKKRKLTASNFKQGSGFVGVNGIFRFNSDGTAQRALAVAQVTNGQVQIIDAAPRSFSRGGS